MSKIRIAKVIIIIQNAIKSKKNIRQFEFDHFPLLLQAFPG